MVIFRSSPLNTASPHLVLADDEALINLLKEQILMSKLDILLKLVNLLDSESAVANDSHIAQHLISKFVIIRTYSAGVHVGYLKEFDARNNCVRLADSRRIWSWEGAFTLSEIANNGIKGGKLSVFINDIVLTGVCEILPTTEQVEKKLREFIVYQS